MNDKSIKKWMGCAFRHKELLHFILDSFRPEDLENGLLILSEQLINQQLSQSILKAASPWVSDYQISFSNNLIFLDVNINAKQAGAVRAMLMLSVEEFTFLPHRHRLCFQYREDIRSLGNPAQSVMIHLLCSGNGALSKLISKNNSFLPGVFADGSVLSLDLDRLLPQKYLDVLKHLTLSYVAAGDGALKLQFSFV